MFKRFLFALTMLAAATSYAAIQNEKDFTKVFENVKALEQDRNFAECINLIDEMIVWIESEKENEVASVKIVGEEIGWARGKDASKGNEVLSFLYSYKGACHTSLDNNDKALQYDKALLYCDKALSLDGDNGYAYFIKACILCKLDNKGAGIELMEISSEKGCSLAKDWLRTYYNQVGITK